MSGFLPRSQPDGRAHHVRRMYGERIGYIIRYSSPGSVNEQYELVELPEPDIPDRDLARLTFDLEADEPRLVIN